MWKMAILLDNTDLKDVNGKIITVLTLPWRVTRVNICLFVSISSPFLGTLISSSVSYLVYTHFGWSWFHARSPGGHSGHSMLCIVIGSGVTQSGLLKYHDSFLRIFANKIHPLFCRSCSGMWGCEPGVPRTTTNSLRMKPPGKRQSKMRGNLGLMASTKLLEISWAF